MKSEMLSTVHSERLRHCQNLFIKHIVHPKMRIHYLLKSFQTCLTFLCSEQKCIFHKKKKK